MIEDYPKFAVVGHPNKGKSSIVSALSLDSSIQISNTPGTTTKQRSFPLKVDGKVIYELIDTPGFQRARRVLSWISKFDVTADKKQDIIRDFINEHRYDRRFNDEIELLEPIINGAGIIYVVDTSKPYGKEYEAEMEILRWTNQPSMALLNKIDNEKDYTKEWKFALGHYFKMVRTFNPMSSDFNQHISILESMSYLKEEWTKPLKDSLHLFKEYHKSNVDKSASKLTKLVCESISLVERLPIRDEKIEDKDREKLEERYKNSLRKLEIKIQKSVESIWNHNNIQKSNESLIFGDIDLFSKESASIFGLSKKEIIVMGTTSGAITGAGVDLLFAGHTLLLGGGIGAVVGGMGAYFGFEELSKVKVLGQKIGHKYLEIGPMENRNFPFILLGRALFHTIQIAKHSHAKREQINISMDSKFKESWLDSDTRKSLDNIHKKFKKNDEVSKEVLEEYSKIISSILDKFVG